MSFVRSKMLIFCGLLFGLSSLIQTGRAGNPRPYPRVDSHLQSTDFLDHESYLVGLDDHQWYLDNVPFIDVPDKAIQDVYYYRTSVIKRHIKWAHEGHGWVVTEFIHPVSCPLLSDSQGLTPTDKEQGHLSFKPFQTPLLTIWLSCGGFAM